MVVKMGSSGRGDLVKLSVCGTRGPGFKHECRHYDFRDWVHVYPASKSLYD